MKRLFSILIIVLSVWSILDAQQNATLKLVTPRMSQKMFRVIKTNPDITQLMYYLLGASSTFDGEQKIEAIVEHPDNAKNALTKLCAFLEAQGGQEYMDANLLRVFYFTAKETQLAKSIYSDYKNQQKVLRVRQELQKEEELIRRWETDGKDEFDFESDITSLIRPRIDIDIDNAIAYIDSITVNPSLSSSKYVAIIDFTISESGKIENFNTSERFGNIFSAENVRPVDPMRYRFEQLDTIVSVPCKVKFFVTERWESIKEIKIEIKFNKKKGLWEISSYDPNEKIESDDFQILNRFLESLPIDDPLRVKKNSICVNICKHWLALNNKRYSRTYPLTPQCRVKKSLQNKSFIQKLGEAHLDW